MVSTTRKRFQEFIKKRINIKGVEKINKLLEKGEQQVRDRSAAG
jgi:hypothetical protein